MVNTNTGVNLTVFSDKIIQYGQDVTRTPITKSINNVTGDETLTSGTNSTITAYISRKTAPWTLDKEGLIQGGDAIMLVLPTQTILKDDIITHNTVKYRVQDVINRDQIGGNVAYKTCNLFKIE